LGRTDPVAVGVCFGGVGEEEIRRGCRGGGDPERALGRRRFGGGAGVQVRPVPATRSYWRWCTSEVAGGCSEQWRLGAAHIAGVAAFYR
jgi:hypothetical protein